MVNSKAAAREYFEKGWVETFSLPAGEKFPPLTGTTGGHKARTEEEVFSDWDRASNEANLGIRCPEDVIFIDIDDYDNKKGLQFFRMAEEELGGLSLDSCYRTSKRGIDSASGQYPFRVKPNIKWASSVCQDVDVIQHGHRYTAAYPSVVKDQAYKWYIGNKEVEIPDVKDLPVLPEAWQEQLQKGPLKKKTSAITVTTSDEEYLSSLEFLRDKFYNPSGDIAGFVVQGLDLDSLAQRLSENAHDTMNLAVYKAIRLCAGAGGSGILTALKFIKKAFMAEVVNDSSSGRTEAVAEKEWRRSLIGAIDGARSDVESGRLMIFNLDPEKYVTKVFLRPKREKPDYRDYSDTDYGHSEMMADYWGDEIKWVKGAVGDDFATYDQETGRWEFVHREQMLNHVREATSEVIRSEAHKIEDKAKEIRSKAVDGPIPDDVDDPDDLMKDAARLHKRANNLEMTPRQLRVLSQLRSKKRMTVDINEFDANPNLIGMKSGQIFDIERLEKGQNPLRDPKPSDMISMSIRTDYAKGARHKAWDHYLETHMPNEEKRKFLQKTMGYSLVDGNPNKMIFFYLGDSDTGKSLILNTCLKVLGDYAGAPNEAKMFADNGSGPNSEMIHNIKRRLVTFSEIGEDVKLSASTIKRVTGGDESQFRGMYTSTIISRSPSFTPYISTNTAPDVKGADQAMKRRLCVVPFTNAVRASHSIDPEMNLLTNEEVWPAVFAWLIEGLELYLKEGLDPAEWPKEVKEASKSFSEALNPVDEWQSECLVFGEENEVAWEDLYKCWSHWAQAQGVHDEGKNRFSRLMARIGFKKSRVRRDGQRIYIVQGVSLISSEQERIDAEKEVMGVTATTPKKKRTQPAQSQKPVKVEKKDGKLKMDLPVDSDTIKKVTKNIIGRRE